MRHKFSTDNVEAKAETLRLFRISSMYYSNVGSTISLMMGGAS